MTTPTTSPLPSETKATADALRHIRKKEKSAKSVFANGSFQNHTGRSRRTISPIMASWIQVSLTRDDRS